jgi:hypothetical protein
LPDPCVSVVCPPPSRPVALTLCLSPCPSLRGVHPLRGHGGGGTPELAGGPVVSHPPADRQLTHRNLYTPTSALPTLRLENSSFYP